MRPESPEDGLLRSPEVALQQDALGPQVGGQYAPYVTAFGEPQAVADLQWKELGPRFFPVAVQDRIHSLDGLGDGILAHGLLPRPLLLVPQAVGESDLALLDLKHQVTKGRVDDDEVGFAEIRVRAGRGHRPIGIGIEHGVVRGQGPESRVHSPLAVVLDHPRVQVRDHGGREQSSPSMPQRAEAGQGSPLSERPRRDPGLSGGTIQMLRGCGLRNLLIRRNLRSRTRAHRRGSGRSKGARTR